MVTTAAPKAAVFPIKEDGIDGARGAVLKAQPIAHLDQFFLHPWRSICLQDDAARLGFPVITAEG